MSAVASFPGGAHDTQRAARLFATPHAGCASVLPEQRDAERSARVDGQLRSSLRRVPRADGHAHRVRFEAEGDAEEREIEGRVVDARAEAELVCGAYRKAGRPVPQKESAVRYILAQKFPDITEEEFKLAGDEFFLWHAIDGKSRNPDFEREHVVCLAQSFFDSQETSEESLRKKEVAALMRMVAEGMYDNRLLSRRRIEDESEKWGLNEQERRDLDEVVKHNLLRRHRERDIPCLGCGLGANLRPPEVWSIVAATPSKELVRQSLEVFSFPVGQAEFVAEVEEAQRRFVTEKVATSWRELGYSLEHLKGFLQQRGYTDDSEVAAALEAYEEGVRKKFIGRLLDTDNSEPGNRPSYPTDPSQITAYAEHHGLLRSSDVIEALLSRLVTHRWVKWGDNPKLHASEVESGIETFLNSRKWAFDESQTSQLRESILDRQKQAFRTALSKQIPDLKNIEAGLQKPRIEQLLQYYGLPSKSEDGEESDVLKLATQMCNNAANRARGSRRPTA